MKRRYVGVMGCLLLAVTSAWAVTDEMSVYTPADPFGWVTYAYDGESDLKDADAGITKGSAAVQEAEALMYVPLMTNGPMALLMGGWVKWDRFEFEDAGMDSLDVYALRAPIDLLCSRFDPLTVWLNVTPSLATDFDGLNREAYRTQFHVVGLYDLNAALQLAAGMAYDSVFGDDELYPLGGVRWRIGKSWDLNLILPEPRVTWSPSETLALFVDARPAGDQWHIREEGERYDLKLESWRVGGGLEYALAEHVWLLVSLGMDVDRTYEIKNDDTTLLDSEAEDTWYARAGLVFR